MWQSDLEFAQFIRFIGLDSITVPTQRPCELWGCRERGENVVKNVAKVRRIYAKEADFSDDL